MAVIVSLAGLAVAAIGLLGVAAPATLTHHLATSRALTQLPVTVGLRVGLGIFFLAAAPHCRLPSLVRLVGMIELLGAGVLLAAGAERLRGFVAWWLRQSPVFVRCWCSGALAFGILLVYAGA